MQYKYFINGKLLITARAKVKDDKKKKLFRNFTHNSIFVVLYREHMK